MKATAKRRKSKAQLKDEKKAEERKQNEITRKLAAYDEMEQKASQVEVIDAEKEQYRQLLNELYESGVIKQAQDGSIVEVEDPAEKESIRSMSKKKAQNLPQAQPEQINSSQAHDPMSHPILDDDLDKNSEML